jgi:hypothetical protein
MVYIFNVPKGNDNQLEHLLLIFYFKNMDGLRMSLQFIVLICGYQNYSVDIETFKILVKLEYHFQLVLPLKMNISGLSFLYDHMYMVIE